MLVFNFREIGNRLFAIRKQAGMTQTEVAEAAGLSDRTYADIERGNVNMRIETILRICATLHITPDIILTKEEPPVLELDAIFHRLQECTPQQQETALRLVEVYLSSLGEHPARP